MLKANNTLIISSLLLSTPIAAIADASESELRYGRDVRPILSDKCFFCHGPDPETREEGLRLDIRAEAIKGKAFVPGKPEESALIKLIHSDDKDKIMPPPKSHKKLTEEEKQILHDWIKAGADYEPHWAYQPPKKNAGDTIDSLVNKSLEKRGLKISEPAPAHTLLRRLHFDITGLPPTPAEVTAFSEAYKSNPQQAVKDTTDKLLASPHYGERMSVKWLDAVRYADTVGYHGDQNTEVSLFRDYVINSFNKDLPYNQFIIEQIAGDLLPNPTIQQRIASSYNRLGQMSQEGGIQDKEYIAKYQSERVRTTSATFLGSTMACAECHDHKFDPITAKDFYSFAAYFSDILEKGAWTGDGKYQEDIQKYLKPNIVASINSRERYGPYLKIPNEAVLAKSKRIDAEIKLLTAEHLKTSANAEQDFTAWLTSLREKSKTKAKPRLPGNIAKLVNTPNSETNPANKDTLFNHYLVTSPAKTPQQKEIKTLVTQKPTASEEYRHILTTVSAKRRTVRLLPRGDWTDESGPIVQPAPPEFLSNGKKVGNTRLHLAKWIASEENPLTARVFVNRVWAQFFGSGLSNSTGDFGFQGEYPSNPELLDWLAVEFVKNNWSIKQLIRTIVQSKTYQQTSTPGGEFIAKDPDNRLLARQTQLRLPAELIRDNALSVSGLLVKEIGGPSVRPYQPTGYYRHLNFPRRTYQASNGKDQYRRGVYTHWQRTFLHPMLKNFGAPNREECTTERADANTPLQALTLLNDPTFTESARVLAAKLIKESKDNLIQRTVMACLSRDATDEEHKILEKLYQDELKRFQADPEAAKKFLSVGLAPTPTDIPAPELAAAASVTRTILNLHETITRY
ncbi:MAG: PSD1 and planctomycete cytochrome C domain-containing protein [Akkermansiaceae bacterium]